MKVPILDLRKQYAPFEEEIDRAFREIRKNTRFIKNKSVKALEERFAELHQVSHAIAVSSGTSALYATLMAESIGLGDEVITTPFTFIATANVIHDGSIKISLFKRMI